MEIKRRVPFAYNIIYPFLLLLATLFMGIGYASVNSITFELSGLANIKAHDGVFISSVSYNSSNGAIDENCKINPSFETMLSTSIELSNKEDSYYMYNVSVYNNTSSQYIYTGAFYDEEFYIDDTGLYNKSIVYEVIGINEGFVLNAKSGVDFQIKFKYLNNDTSQNVLDSYINFLFKKIYLVTYTNIDGNYIDYAIEGEDFILDFGSNNYDSLSIKMNNEKIEDYKYENNILTIFNVNGDLEIAYIENSSLMPEGGDFVVSIMEQGGHYYLFTLENTTSINSTGWTVYAEVPDGTTIATSYNCTPRIEGNLLIVDNAPWNGTISAGQKQYNIFGITLNIKDENYKLTNYKAFRK